MEIFAGPLFEVIFASSPWVSKGKFLSEVLLFFKIREIGHSQQEKKHIFQMRPFLAQWVHSVMFYCMSKMGLSLGFDVCQNINNFHDHNVKDYSGL